MWDLIKKENISTKFISAKRAYYEKKSFLTFMNIIIKKTKSIISTFTFVSTAKYYLERNKLKIFFWIRKSKYLEILKQIYLLARLWIIDNVI